MGLFDQISGMVSSALGGGDSTGADSAGAGGVQGQVMEVLQQHGISGISGVIQQFEQTGMGAHVASWVGNGENLPISADQVQQALGSPVIASIAQRFGIDPGAAANLLAQHLPATVDQATASGTATDPA